NERKMDIETIKKNLIKSIERKLEIEKGRLCTIYGKLDALSPLKVLSRGYGIARNESGEIIKSVSKVRQGDFIELIISDGTIHCEAEEIIQADKSE
ncbi:MAG TPA: exodeoxyribonuclease VII large subunit, partial [Clostridia bacterium]